MVSAWQMLGLGLDYVLATIAVFIFLFFVKRISASRKNTKEIYPFLGLALLALFMGIAFIISSWFNFFRWEYSLLIDPLFKLYSMAITLAFVALAFFIENVLQKTNYIITLYMVTGFIIMLFFNRFENLNTITLIIALPAIIFFLILFYFTFVKPTSGYLYLRMIFSFFGLILVAIAMILRNDKLVESIGEPFFPFATFIAILGVCLVFYGFSAFSSFTDINWKEKLRELYVISEAGICLYAFSFEKLDPMEVGNTDLIAGGFSGVRMLLAEMLQTPENLRIIDYQNLKIMLEQREGIVFILVIKEESPFLSYKLKTFASEFQRFFGDVLKTWNNELSMFNPTKTIIKNVFEISV